MKNIEIVIFILANAWSIRRILEFSITKSFVYAVISNLISGVISYLIIFNVIGPLLKGQNPNSAITSLFVGFFGGLLSYVCLVLCLKIFEKVKIRSNQMTDLFLLTLFLNLLFAMLSFILK